VPVTGIAPQLADFLNVSVTSLGGSGPQVDLTWLERLIWINATRSPSALPRKGRMVPFAYSQEGILAKTMEQSP